MVALQMTHGHRHFDPTSTFLPVSAPSWAILVRKSAIGVDGVEGLTEIVGERVGGGDGLPTGLDLDGAVAAGGADELPD